MVPHDFGMTYSAEGHLYLLVPDYVVNIRSLRVTGAGIFTPDEKYLGYWDSFNMPMSVVNELASWIEKHRKTELANRRLNLRLTSPFDR